MTQLGPTLGAAIVSFTNSTIYSIKVTQLDFFLPLLDKYFLIGRITTIETINATSHNIKTCFVTEKSIPKNEGK